MHACLEQLHAYSCMLTAAAGTDYTLWVHTMYYTVTGLARGVAACEWPWLERLDHSTQSTRSSPTHVTTEARLVRSSLRSN